MTFGWGVNESGSWPKILERRLNQKAEGNYEVLNMGVPGHETQMEVGMLQEKGLKYNPDKVIIQFHENDAINRTRKLELRKKNEHSIEKYIEEGMTRREAKIKRSRDIYKELRNERMEMSMSERMRGIENAFDDLADIRDEEGFEVYIFGWPVRNKKHAKYLKNISKDFDFNYLNLEDELLNKYYAYPKGEPYLYKVRDGHPNRKGHELIVKGMLDSENYARIVD